jgi:DsbC/DsbD-like thiol-disulfide interchange protein
MRAMKAFVCGLIIVGLATFAGAQKKLGEAASIKRIDIVGQAVPGALVTAKIKVQLEKGYHVHSSKPSEPQYIATKLTLEPPAGAKAGTILYPEGKSEKVVGLDKPLSVYEGEFEVSVPVGLSASARLPLTIPAALRYQACKGAQCYAPQTLKFDIPLSGSK